MPCTNQGLHMPQVDTNTLNTVKFDSLMMQIKDAMYKSGFTPQVDTSTRPIIGQKVQALGTMRFMTHQQPPLSFAVTGTMRFMTHQQLPLFAATEDDAIHDSSAGSSFVATGDRAHHDSSAGSSSGATELLEECAAAGSFNEGCGTGGGRHAPPPTTKICASAGTVCAGQELV